MKSSAPSSAARHAVRVAGARGEHDHGQPRRRRRLAETAQGLEAVGLRHDHVQDDQVGGGLRQPRQRRPSAAHRGGVEAGGVKDHGEDPADLGLVVHYQDSFGVLGPVIHVSARLAFGCGSPSNCSGRPSLIHAK
jgi:hypothetical protein